MPLSEIYRVISFIDNFRTHNPTTDKEVIARAVETHFKLSKARSVYAGPHFALRFSTASGNSFPNSVVGLSVLHRYDSKPFIVVIVNGTKTHYLMANSSFLKKISHSSSKLRPDNIRGTFLGNDIFRELNGTKNAPDSFKTLWKMHTEATWEKNVDRLVQSTKLIVGTGTRFTPSVSDLANIDASVRDCSAFLVSGLFDAVSITFSNLCNSKQASILKAASIDNVNLRGNSIEQLITESGNGHRIDDYRFDLSGYSIIIDIKSKVMNKTSSPKGYNIDKMLQAISCPRAIMLMGFVGIDTDKNTILPRLVPIFDTTLRSHTAIQHHWTGRNSRGTAQFTSGFEAVFGSTFKPSIDVDSCHAWLSDLISR